MSRGASTNGNFAKPEYSKDFLKIKMILEEHRKKIQVMRKELRLFRKIKRLVLEAGNEEPEKIHEVLPRMAALFPKNVDKKPLLR